MKIRGSVPYYIKFRLRTHKNIGAGPIRLPEEEPHTRSYWFTIDEEMSAGCSANDMQHALLSITQLEGGAR
ncbi:MAG: box helicase [Paenibacillus sp.]|jgi:DEAD/DEAH box helicase domain-containing protein|nr:box helicase [Paenibacillus sp.]